MSGIAVVLRSGAINPRPSKSLSGTAVSLSSVIVVLLSSATFLRSGSAVVLRSGGDESLRSGVIVDFLARSSGRSRYLLSGPAELPRSGIAEVLLCGPFPESGCSSLCIVSTPAHLRKNKGKIKGETNQYHDMLCLEW